MADRAADATQRAANATANAAANAADRAAASVNAGANAAANANNRFGYTSTTANSPQAWFYDYYSYSPTYYSPPASGSQYYSRASRYYDYDNDGVYDSLSTYRDADNAGAYQAYDRLDFGVVSNDSSVASSSYVNDAQRHTVQGTIDATRLSKVNGTENLVVRLASRQADSNETIVDLGPAARWKNVAQVKEGNALTATGPMEQVGEKKVLIAESAAIGQQQEEIRITRSGPVIQGQVIDVTRAQVQGAEHVMAVVQSESNRQVVDLGPAEKLEVSVEPQTKIVVQGIPVQFRDYSVVLADRVDLNGKSITIERW